MRKRKLLVTGGAGFIGANFVHYRHAAYPEGSIVILDALTYAGNRNSLKALETSEKIHFVHGNIRDLPLVERLLRDHRIDTVVHFAAESHVDRSISGPDVFIETNIEGTHTLLKAALSRTGRGMTGGMPLMPPDPGKFWAIRRRNPLKPVSKKRSSGIWTMMSGGKW